VKQITLEKLMVDRDRFDALVAGHWVHLTFSEFELLWCLAQNADKVVSRERLEGVVWGGGAADQPKRALDVHVARIRKKLGDDGSWAITAVKKRGYMLTSQPTQVLSDKRLSNECRHSTQGGSNGWVKI